MTVATWSTKVEPNGGKIYKDKEDADRMVNTRYGSIDGAFRISFSEFER